MRSQRPAAAAALPSIIATNAAPIAPAPPPPYSSSNGHANGHAHANGHHPGAVVQNGATYAPIPQAAQHAAIGIAREDGMQPVLPPRPTGRMPASHAGRTSWWKSWPLVVIVLAVLAIVTAVILMVWPPSKPASADSGKKNIGMEPPPAPEHMDTNPLPPNQPPAKSSDPNKVNPKIDIPDDPDPLDPLPGGATGSTGGGNGKSTLSGKNAIMMEIPLKLCERAKTCGKLDDTLEVACAATKAAIQPFNIVPPTNCSARTRCLAKVDQLSCDDDFSAQSATKLMTTLQDCVEAISSC